LAATRSTITRLEAEGMRNFVSRIFTPAALIALTLLAASPLNGETLDQVIDRISAREKQLIQSLRHYSPRLETYIQIMRPDPELGSVPAGDRYFLGRLDLSRRVDEKSFLRESGQGTGLVSRIVHFSRLDFVPDGFAQMTMMDANDFDRQHYHFAYVRREFLGDLRCYVFDVVPLPKSGRGRFLGRIWVEDQEFNVVRFNGTYGPAQQGGMFFHFDSWRGNLQPGLWLPTYIYSEESDVRVGMAHARTGFKAQTRIWGYDLRGAGGQEEFTNITVESASQVKDQSNDQADASPIESERDWQREAEQNAVERLERAGLIAPAGPVDKILETVVSNLEVTNNLDIEPPIACRTLETTPLESFTIGHTIVLSRGLVDVLPDESSLAMVLAHQLAHVVLGHQLDTKYAFNDRMLFPDEASFRNMSFAHTPHEEDEADVKAAALLKNSPYKDKLNNAGLFLRAVNDRAAILPNLLTAFMGDPLVSNGRVQGLAQIMASSPQLQMMKADEVAALPLGGRVKVDPWNGRLELMKTRAVSSLTPREKIPFELTPLRPHMMRLGPSQQVALKAGS
jgi:hypothetical protein